MISHLLNPQDNSLSTLGAALLFIGLSFYGHALFAHNLWIETEATGQTEQVHQVHVFYGEYPYEYYEEVSGAFRDVDDFTLWLIAPDGTRIELETTAGETSYTAEFTPAQEGVYTILLNSTSTEVVDWTEYDLGILKPGFYASASVVIGNGTDRTAEPEVLTSSNDLVIYDGAHAPYSVESTVDIQVLFNGEPLAEQEIILGIAGQWYKYIYTDEQGRAQFTLPWEGQYVTEVIYTEEAPGSFNGTDYATVRHTATYSISTVSE